jgi:circadian clock protein KaiC
MSIAFQSPLIGTILAYPAVGVHALCSVVVGKRFNMSDARGHVHSARRHLPVGISGLDDVLDGGLIRGGLYLLLGAPGTGKTTAANQICFSRAREGDVAVYGTVLVESHARMLTHLEGFHFFDPSQVARNVHYVSLLDELTASGLDGALGLLRRVVRERGAALLIVDGAGLFGEFAPSPLEFRRFAAELHTQVSALGCTTVLLASPEDPYVRLLGPHVDGVIELEDARVGMRDVRLLHVVKLRASNPLRGRHAYAIDARGMVVFPRLEATTPETVTVSAGDVVTSRVARPRMAFGVAGLDDMVRGGLPATSSTLLLGTAGAGKTVTGLHFINEGSQQGDRTLIVSSQETPARLLAKATDLGLDLASHVEADLVRILWQPPGELSLDAWALELLTVIDDYRPARLFCDELGDVAVRAAYPDRLPLFLAALVTALRERVVTVIFAVELRRLVGEELEIPPSGFPVDLDNVLLVRSVEWRSHLHRLVSVIKLRDGDHDTAIREFRISSRGVEVSNDFASAESVMTGIARDTALVTGGSGTGGRGG